MGQIPRQEPASGQGVKQPENGLSRPGGVVKRRGSPGWSERRFPQLEASGVGPSELVIVHRLPVRSGD